jgi:hypothetical protein
LLGNTEQGFAFLYGVGILCYSRNGETQHKNNNV